VPGIACIEARKAIGNKNPSDGLILLSGGDGRLCDANRRGYKAAVSGEAEDAARRSKLRNG